MKYLLSAFFSLFFSSAGFAIGVATGVTTDHLQFLNPWIAEAPPGAQVMAGFMEIHNTSAETVTIVSVTSPAFNSVEMHLSKDVDGTAKMLPQDNLRIPANGRLILSSGGYHLMLIKPHKPLHDGDKIQLNFTLSSSETISQDVFIKKNTTKNKRPMKCGEGKCGGGKCGGS